MCPCRGSQKCPPVPSYSRAVRTSRIATSPRRSTSSSIATSLIGSQGAHYLELRRECRPLEQSLQPALQARRERDTEHLADAHEPRREARVREQALPELEGLEPRGQKVPVAAAEGVVLVAEQV